jgi:hypothetical protein
MRARDERPFRNMPQGLAKSLFPFAESSVWFASMMILTVFAAVLMLGFTPAPQRTLLLLSLR